MRISVVATSLGAEGIEGEPDKNILIADLPEAFTQACLSLSKDVQLRTKIGRNAHKTITEKYSWAGVLKPLIEAVEEGKEKYQ